MKFHPECGGKNRSLLKILDSPRVQASDELSIAMHPMVWEYFVGTFTDG